MLPGEKMTKAQAGRLGGKATFQKHGSAHMQAIGKAGAESFWKKYTVQPCGVSGWLIVCRETGKVKAKIGNLPTWIEFKQEN